MNKGIAIFIVLMLIVKYSGVTTDNTPMLIVLMLSAIAGSTMAGIFIDIVISANERKDV